MENTYFIVLRRTFFQNVFTFFLIDFILLVCLCAQICFSIFEVQKELNNNDMKTERRSGRRTVCHPSVFEVGAGSQVQSTFAIDLCHAETTGMDQK